MDFNFLMPARVISGKGCLEKNEGVIKSLGSRCLIVTGAGSAAKSGALDAAKAALKNAGTDYIIYDRITANPLLSACFEAGSTARKFRADLILGIGGGSVLDASKAAAVFAANPSFTPGDFLKGAFVKSLPLAVVGTTAGTGSEVTGTAVVTLDDTHVKKAVTHRCCFATVVFADPAFTSSCPYGLTVSAALEALCHAVEAYYAAAAGDIARASALEAVKLLWPELMWLYSNRDALPGEEKREQLYYGSLWAGMAASLAGTGFPHPAGHPLSLELGLPHGRACAVFLPDYVRHNAPAASSLTLKLFGVLGCGTDAFCEKVSALTAVKGVRLPHEKCVQFADALEGVPALSNAVNPTTPEEMRLIYEKLFS